MRRVLLMIFLCIIAASLKLHAQEAFVVREVGEMHEIKYPREPTTVLNVHFEKLGTFYSYFDRLDSNLKKEKPYVDYFKKAPFATYMVARYEGDTVTLSAYAMKAPRNSAAEDVIVNEVKQSWNYEGWLIPLFFVSDLKKVQIRLEDEQELLFRVRFLWKRLRGEECIVLQKE